MPEIDRKKLSELYPRVKSYDELEQARRVRAEIRRPKLVAFKVGGYLTAALIVVLLGIYLISMLINGNLSSAGDIMAMVSFSILVGLTGMAILLYIYFSVEKLIDRVLVNSAPFNFAIFTLLIIVGFILSFVIQNTSANLFYIAGVLFMNFILTLAVTQAIITLESR